MHDMHEIIHTDIQCMCRSRLVALPRFSLCDQEVISDVAVLSPSQQQAF